MNSWLKHIATAATGLFSMVASSGCIYNVNGELFLTANMVNCGQPLEGYWVDRCEQFQKMKCDLVERMEGKKNCSEYTVYLAPIKETGGVRSPWFKEVALSTYWLKKYAEAATTADSYFSTNRFLFAASLAQSINPELAMELSEPEKIAPMDWAMSTMYHEFGHEYLQHAVLGDSEEQHEQSLIQEFEADLFGMIGLSCVGKDPKIAIKVRLLDSDHVLYDDSAETHPMGVTRAAYMGMFLSIAKEIQEGKAPCPLRGAIERIKIAEKKETRVPFGPLAEVILENPHNKSLFSKSLASSQQPLR